MTRDEVLAILRQFKQKYGQYYSIVRIGVFGSVARNEAGANSDVDIVFQTDAPNLFRTASMKAELENLLAREVDIVRLRESMNLNLRRHILEEAQFV